MKKSNQNFNEMNNSNQVITDGIRKLLPIIEEHKPFFVDGKAFHKRLGLGKDFASWIKYQIERFAFEKDKDYIIIINPNDAPAIKGGANRKDFYLTIQMALEIGLIYSNQLGKDIRMYLIRIESEAKGGQNG